MGGIVAIVQPEGVWWPIAGMLFQFVPMLGKRYVSTNGWLGFLRWLCSSS